MNIQEYEFRQKIYDLVNGYLTLEDPPSPESQYVIDEFSEGSLCSDAYAQILDAYSRLCRRLNVQDQNDADIEIIIDSFNTITHHISLKMFEYGVLFAKMEKQVWL